MLEIGVMARPSATRQKMTFHTVKLHERKSKKPWWIKQVWAKEQWILKIGCHFLSYVCSLLIYHPVSLLSTEIQNFDRNPFHPGTMYLYVLFPFGTDLVIILTFKMLSYKNANRCHTLFMPKRHSWKVKVGIYGVLGMILGNYNAPFRVI